MPLVVVSSLTKSFGSRIVVDDLSFTVSTGRVVGFLGPNGAGKTTTLRLLLGLARPDRGSATVAGRRFADLDDPVRTVGASLDSSGAHPGRTGRDHLLALARAGGVHRGRVDELLEQVGLTEAGRRRTRGYSLGMHQRLGLAAALLGDPQVLVLDEPANGLDPQGVRWLRDVLRGRAARGCAVLVSSHSLAEMAQTVDDVVLLDRGRSVLQAPLSQLLHQHPGASLEDVFLSLTGSAA